MSTQEANQILNALLDKEFVAGVIATTEIYTDLKGTSLELKSEVIKNLISLGMTSEDAEYWVSEFFEEELNIND
jgi:hypothetical protein